MIALAGFVIVGAVVAWWFFIRGDVAAAAKKQAGKPQIKQVVRLESFLVNLADPEENRFLRLGIELGLEKELPEGEEDLVPTALLRDTVLEVLTTWQSSALLAPEGKAKLKAELLRAFAEKVPELKVREIYFTDFLVQL